MPGEDINELMTCPLCGNTVEWEYAELDSATGCGDDSTGYIKCYKCGLVLHGSNREDTESHWNRSGKVITI